jgi:alpha,alpha-trehalase
MYWVALDRALKIADLLNAHDRIESWRATREQIRDAILTDRDVTCTRMG